MLPGAPRALLSHALAHAPTPAPTPTPARAAGLRARAWARLRRGGTSRATWAASRAPRSSQRPSSAAWTTEIRACCSHALVESQARDLSEAQAQAQRLRLALSTRAMRGACTAPRRAAPGPFFCCFSYASAVRPSCPVVLPAAVSLPPCLAAHPPRCSSSSSSLSLSTGTAPHTLRAPSAPCTAPAPPPTSPRTRIRPRPFPFMNLHSQPCQAMIHLPAWLGCTVKQSTMPSVTRQLAALRRGGMLVHMSCLCTVWGKPPPADDHAAPPRPPAAAAAAPACGCRRTT